jgi:TonB family protein
MLKKYILSFCLFFVTGVLLAQSDQGSLTEVEQMPYFPGCGHLKNDSEDKRNCSNQAIVNYIANDLKYPSSAKTAGIQGTVYVSFDVNENGYVSRVSLLKNINEACGKEAIRVIQNMPRWEPAMNNGKPIKVELNIPIHFYLKDDQTDKASTYQINWGGLAAKRVTVEQLQNNLNKKVLVRDEHGNDLPCSELIFSYERKRTFLQEKTNGSVNGKVEKMLSKVKPGSTFVIVAVIQQQGEFIEVEKIFEIVE